MKIKINQSETYEIKLQDEISASELNDLIERLNQIKSLGSNQIISEKKVTKNSSSDDPLQKHCIYCNNKGLWKSGTLKGVQRYQCKSCKRQFSEMTDVNSTKKPRKYKKRSRRKALITWNDRNEVIKALKLHYSGTKTQKSKYADSKNVPDWNYISKSLTGLRRRFNIRPKEVGLNRFPTTHWRTR